MRRFRRFFSRWQNWVGLLLILVYVGVAIFAPYISPDNPKHPGAFMRVGKATDPKPHPPDENAILGMLPFGIDVFHALVWGSRGALQFGLIVTISTALFGSLYGAISGFAGNRLGSLMIRVADSFLAFPPIAGFIFLQQLFLTTVTSMGGLNFFSPFSRSSVDPLAPTPFIQTLLEQVNPLMLSLIVFSWMPFARLVNSIVLTLKQSDFIQAARALGGSPFWIIRKHILRNSIGPAIVLAARDVGGVVLLQATLTFVGIGGGSIWGTMLSEGRDWVIGPGGALLRYWWVFLPPTIAVMIFGIAWNMFGDSLNDILEPTSHDGLRSESFWKRKGTKTASPADELPGSISTEVYQNALPVEEQDLRSKPAGKVILPQVIDPLLLTARDELSRGDLTRAIHVYNHMIQRGRSVREVLPDLAQLVKKYPRDAQVWQILGDALARAGDDEHAAQSYAQAQKLMQ